MRTAISRIIVLATVLLAGTAWGQSVSTVTSAFNASPEVLAHAGSRNCAATRNIMIGANALQARANPV